MTYQKFQKEVAHIWNNSTDAGFVVTDCDTNVESILHKYSWEVGKMELRGANKQQQVAYLWEQYKKDFPHLITHK